ncbi:uncharacterized protein LOC112500631 [Cynara cardunculus var. scolymus]|uniref:Phox/Bem1p n=1 Tax=Cynara cardunculus var. scolymus TaxID=59895 RepID=A0A118K0U2_CYNCS|nr:uncharacterized protein LOC112500631 [Cynara cardunculus var. scolymus]KVI01875.1 Phox/Bem1p [Cynara cardunculus var. scolymus]
MENYSYTSYPESGGSSPRSREVDFENPPPWEDQSTGNNSNNNYKVKLMCSYGGKIHPRPHDNQLSYVGGETKILAVDRFVKFAAVNAKLTALCDGEVCFKYQLPGEDLDALISVTNDDDLEHMMHEYDRLNRASPSPARLRLFLFPLSGQSPALTPVHSFGSTEGRSERERFMDALNSGHVQPNTPPSAPPPHGNVERFFGSDKGMPMQPSGVASKTRDQHIADPHIHPHEPEIAVLDERGIEADRIQKHIQDLQRLRIGEEQQPALYRKPSDDNLGAGYTGDYYVPKMTEKVAPTTLPGTVPAPAAGYQISGGFTTSTISSDQQPVYMIPAHASMYHAPMARPATAPVNHGQGYYVQRMPTEVYRDQPVYNAMQPVQSMATQPILPPQQPQKITTHSEGVRMVHSTAGMTDAGYAQVAYDNGVGRHVYYTPQGTMVTPQPTTQQFHAMAAPSAALNQGGKVVASSKISQGSI